jgi:serine/threonine-protein kinase HipA
MTSNTECFVYMTLPGQTSFTTAGKFVMDKTRQGQPLGKFIYGKSYLANEQAVPIDPIELKLTDTTYETQGQKGLFGALRDASPDYWGRRVIERHLKSTALSELDYLLHSPDDRAGALGFGLSPKPPAPLREFNRTMDLEKLQDRRCDHRRRGAAGSDADAQQAHELLAAPAWAVPAPRPSSKTTKDSGSQNSTVRMTSGITPDRARDA